MLKSSRLGFAVLAMGIVGVCGYFSAKHTDVLSASAEPNFVSSDQVTTPTTASKPKPLEDRGDNHAAISPISASESGRAIELSETMLVAPLLGVIDANAKTLTLTAEQKALLAENYLTYVHVRLQIEKALIRVKSSDGNKLLLEIPPYPEQGKALRKSLYDQLQADFSPDEVEKIDEVLGPFFEERFKGYGISEQSFELSRAASAPTEYRVIWSATPSSHIKDRHLGYAGSEGQTTIGPNELIAGNYSVLRDIITEHLR